MAVLYSSGDMLILYSSYSSKFTMIIRADSDSDLVSVDPWKWMDLESELNLDLDLLFILV